MNKSRDGKARKEFKKAKQRGEATEVKELTRKDRARAKRRHEDVNQAAFRVMRESTES